MAEKLIRFVENFSWEEVKEHILWVLRTWELTDWEAVFVAMADGQIVGMASIMKADYYPLPEIYPWISSVFVTEEYHGHRVSEKLINFANIYAKEVGFVGHIFHRNILVCTKNMGIIISKILLILGMERTDCMLEN